MKRLFVAAVVVWGSVANADEPTAKKKYEEGERAYNLGQFKRAVELFTEAYEQHPNPTFLFNIAQTYRQAGDCKQSQFFYKRFLALKANDPQKPLKPERVAEIEQRIAELEECIKREMANKPPDQLDPQAGKGTPGKNPKPTPATSTAQAPNNETDTGEEEEEEPPVAPPATGPKLFSARVVGGAGLLTAAQLDTGGLHFAGALLAGYPLSINDKVMIELGAALTYVPVPYALMPMGNVTGGLIGVLANVGPSYTVIPKLAIRADVGLGGQLFTGLEHDGNPFTVGGAPATGPLGTFLVRAALSADYAVTPNIVIVAMPIAFTYSPAPAGFKPEISSLTTLSFAVGVGYRQ